MQYNYKLYSNSGTFKKVVNPSVIKSSVKFTAQKNGGQGNMSLSIGEIDTDFVQGDIVKIYANSGTNRLIYSGYIDEIRESRNQGEDMQISCIGLGSILTNAVFTSGGVRIFTLNKTAGEIVTDIVAYASSVNSNISAGTIATTVGALNIGFSNTNCLDALKSVIDLAPDYFFYIDANGSVHFEQKSVTTDYFVTFQKDLQSYEEINSGKIFNKLYLTWDSGSKTYTDSTSITEYGTREASLEDTEIKNETTADARALKYFEDNAYPQEERQLLVNRQFNAYETLGTTWDSATFTWEPSESWNNSLVEWNYASYKWSQAGPTWESLKTRVPLGFEVIQVGNVIKVLNFSKTVIGEIEKLEYSRDFVRLYLNSTQNLIQLLKT